MLAEQLCVPNTYKAASQATNQLPFEEETECTMYRVEGRQAGSSIEWVGKPTSEFHLFSLPLEAKALLRLPHSQEQFRLLSLFLSVCMGTTGLFHCKAP